jgi:hypothetical protein
MRVIVEQLVEWRLAGETEVLGENLLEGQYQSSKSILSMYAYVISPEAISVVYLINPANH